MLTNPLKPDKGVQQDVALDIIGKIGAGNNLHPTGFGSKRCGQKPMLTRVFDRVIDMSTQRCSKMTSASGCIGDQMVSVLVEYIAPGVGIRIGNIVVEFFPDRIVSPGSTIRAPTRTIWSLYLGMQKGAHMH